MNITSRTDDIRAWYRAHTKAGKTRKALSLLFEERNQCVLIMSLLRDSL